MITVRIPIYKDQGPYSWKILVLRVGPSNKILRKFLEMWVFPLKFKEKILVVTGMTRRETFGSKCKLFI